MTLSGTTSAGFARTSTGGLTLSGSATRTVRMTKTATGALTLAGTAT